MEVIRENYFLIFYALALLLALGQYRKYFDSLLKYFPMIIAYTLISEILGTVVRDYENIQIVYLEGYSFYNQLIFNIFDIVFFLYFFYVYRNAVSEKKYKKWIIYGAILFIACSLINPFYQDFLLYPQMIASSIGSLVLAVCTILYFLKLKSKTNIPYHRNLLFWISLGLLIFYSFYPLILTVGYFNYELYQKLHARTIHHFLIAMMYSCFILGFILMRRIRPLEDMWNKKSPDNTVRAFLYILY